MNLTSFDGLEPMKIFFSCNSPIYRSIIRGIGVCVSYTAVIFAVFLVTGCSSTYAPVEQRDSGSYRVKKKPIGKIPVYYKVKRGDTLYSIAWNYGLDYKNIASYNRLKSPYRIYVGDKLRLGPRAHKQKTVTQHKSVSGVKRAKKYTKTYAKNEISKKAGAYKSRSNNHRKAKVRESSKKTKKQALKKVASKKKTNNLRKKAVTGNTISSNNSSNKSSNKSTRLKWIWPVKGKIIQSYVPNRGKKGIDISASKGAMIKSSEAGRVVYSGDGLVGYGRLIIIKHDEIFLSAYAHNQNLLVNEGQTVKKGQNIARLGRSGTDRFKLHFEIRKNGKPVNPLKYLPR